ncbi:protein JINGUBANG-like [Senna tora]|uniref:Protein JINGUBANG-like n=1 Tax=Senna tora TaxID=362788 RepID=A0A835CDK5_9FABA|nr:protein JINGUBANG-like [Senna tora]
MEMEFHRSYSTSSSSSSSHHNNKQLYSLSSQRSLASIPSLNHHQSSSATYHHCLATLKGHTSSYISSLTLAGKFLYTGSSNREIRSWNHTTAASSAAGASAVTAGKGAVKSLVVQSDKLFSAHQDYKIRVWKITTNVNDGEDEDDAWGAEVKYTRVATLPTLGDRACKVLNPKNHVQIRRHKKCTWVHHVDTVSALALSRDHALLYSVSWDRSIKIWRTTDFTCVESVNNAHDDAINAVAVSRDGHVYTGSADKKIKIWRNNQNRNENEKKGIRHCLVGTLEKHKSGINALALSVDGSVLYSGACDRSILVWEKRREGEGEGEGIMVVVGALRGHTKSILCLAVVGDLVCSGSADKSIRVWRGVRGGGGGGGEYECLAVLEGHMGPVKCLAAVEDKGNDSASEACFLVYSGGLDCDVKLIKINVRELI